MESKTRTIKQNRALHSMFTQLSDELTNAGLDIRKTLKPTVDIPWSASLVKELIWRPVMKAVTDKDSTTEITTKEIDQVFEVISKHLGEKFGLDIQFPSMDSLLDESLTK